MKGAHQCPKSKLRSLSTVSHPYLRPGGGRGMTIYTCLYISHTYLSYYVSFLINVHIHFVSFYTLLLVLVTVYLSSHNSVMLLISFHIMSFIIFKSFTYSCHLFLYFMSAYTLEVDMRNYKDPKVLLSLYETTNYKGPKALLSL